MGRYGLGVGVFSSFFLLANCSSTPAPIPDSVEAVDREPAAVNCPNYTFEKADYNFAPYIQSKFSDPAVIGAAKVELDVGNKVLFRGTNWASKQFNEPQVIRAMLGDSTAYIGTFLFDDTVRFLGGEKTIYPKYAEVVAPIQTALQAAEKCVREAHGGLKLKQHFARDLTSKYFWSVQNSGPGRINAIFLDYDSNERQDWSPALLFGTVISEIADYYGGKTILYRDPRAFSLALYNLDLSNMNKMLTADIGEAIVPGFLPPSSVLGLDWKTNDIVGGHDNDVWDKQIDFSIRREIIDGVPLALVLDSKGQDAILRLDDGTYAAGSIRGIRGSFTETDHPGLPSPAATKIKLMGAFRVGPGELPASLKKKFVASGRPLPESLKTAMVKATVAGSPIHYVAVTWVIPDPLIEIKSASFGFGIPGIQAGNVTEAARKSPCQGQAECDYKVAAKFIGDPAPGKEKAFELKWFCRNHPKDIKTERLPAPADGKIIHLKCSP